MLTERRHPSFSILNIVKLGISNIAFQVFSSLYNTPDSPTRMWGCTPNTNIPLEIFDKVGKFVSLNDRAFC